ncbi:MAG: site-2 protease family protein [Candidatus Poseidoniaceae archaeon]|jgi:membrane-associated protease RseP (regulator of RpoE activity)|nr:site-2 protease family protein [Candidatus Poseidoniaceae archaeon]
MGSGLFAIEADWSFVFLFIILWYILVRSWESSGKLDDWNASRALGFILMLRTSWGKSALEKISKPRKFWRAYGELSLWVCWFSMFAVGLVLLLAVISALLVDTKVDPPSASELVAIPGLNPMIPLGWGTVAFVVCLVIHEFGHGIQARAHGMRVRNFGLLLLGPIPLGAFAEPEHSEIIESPRRERQRMFAAGPATNIFAALLLMILMGPVAGQFVAAESGVHSSQIIKETGAEEGGLQPWDTIIEIDGDPIATTDDFSNKMDELSAGDSVHMKVIRYADGSIETIVVNLTDKYDYYLELGWDVESLEVYGIEEGDAFLGVENLAGGTAGIDRLAGWAHPDFEGNMLTYSVAVPLHTLNILVTPFQYQGVAIHPAQEEMLAAGDGWLASLVGLEGLLFLVNLIFWLIWVNILLGFTNLIPMVPFDGGHLFKDIVHGLMNGLRKIGKRTGFWSIHPLWVNHVTTKASSMSSLLLLLVLAFLMISPYF